MNIKWDIYFNYYRGTLINKECGNKGSFSVHSSGKAMFVHFVSDSSETAAGFKARVIFEIKSKHILMNVLVLSILWSHGQTASRRFILCNYNSFRVNFTRVGGIQILKKIVHTRARCG